MCLSIRWEGKCKAESVHGAPPILELLCNLSRHAICDREFGRLKPYMCGLIGISDFSLSARHDLN
jgi:hypothetical protein